MIRKGHYCKYKGRILECATGETVIIWLNDNDLTFLGLNKHSISVNSSGEYYIEVPKEEIEWFCKICTKGKYKGEDVNIDGEENGKYLISSNLILAKDRGVFNEEHGFKDVMDGGYGTYVYAGYVDKSEVTDVKEVKTPINEYLKAPDNWDF